MRSKTDKGMIIGFDLDGTLIDSLPLGFESFNFAARQMGYKVTKEQFFSQQSTTTEDILRHIIKHMSNDDVLKFIRIRTQFYHQNIHKLRLFSDTVKTLHEVRKKGKILIISNTEYSNILTYIESVGLNPLFFEMIIGRDLVEHPKPEPDEIFIAQRIEHHKLDYFVGDSVVDIKTGRRAGVKTIAVATGFNSKEELLKEKPYRVIDNLSEILDII